MEEDLHGPGIDARGAAFPGVNQYVELGHGRDYAWSATTSTSDNVSTFAEVLCQDAYHYLYKGQCLPMEKLVDVDSWHPTVADMTPAGHRDADRLPHGPRDRLRARDGPRQAGRVRPRPLDLLPRGRLGDRLLGAQRPELRHRARVIPAGRLAHQLPLQLGLRRRQPHLLLHVGLDAAARQGRLAGLPDPRHRPVRLEGLRSRDPRRHLAAVRRAPAHHRPGLHGLVEQQAGAGMVGGRQPVGLRPGLPQPDDRRAGSPPTSPTATRSRSPRSCRRWTCPRPRTSARPSCRCCSRRSASRRTRRCAPRSPSSAPGTRRRLPQARVAPRLAPRPVHARDRADGRLVAEAALSAEFTPMIGAGRRSARSRRCCRSAARRRSPATASTTAGGATSPRTCAGCIGVGRERAPYSAGVLRQPPRPALLQQALRDRCPRRCGLAAAGDRASRRSSSTAASARSDPEPACADQNTWTERLGDHDPAVPVPEPPDLPAGRDAHAQAAAMSARGSLALACCGACALAAASPSVAAPPPRCRSAHAGRWITDADGPRRRDPRHEHGLQARALLPAGDRLRRRRRRLPEEHRLRRGARRRAVAGRRAAARRLRRRRTCATSPRRSRRSLATGSCRCSTSTRTSTTSCSRARASPTGRSRTTACHPSRSSGSAPTTSGCPRSSVPSTTSGQNSPGPGGVGLQDRYAAAWAHVARRFAGNRNVLGYELMNEPWPGSIWSSCAQTQGCPTFDTGPFASFYRLVIGAIRRVDRRTLIWYEPQVLFNYGSNTNLPSLGDPRLGFAFHDYCLENDYGGGTTSCQTFDDMVFANALARTCRRPATRCSRPSSARPEPRRSCEPDVQRADQDMVSWLEWAYLRLQRPDDLRTRAPSRRSCSTRRSRRAARTSTCRRCGSSSSRIPQLISGTPAVVGIRRLDEDVQLQVLDRSRDRPRALRGGHGDRRSRRPRSSTDGRYAAAVVGRRDRLAPRRVGARDRVLPRRADDRGHGPSVGTESGIVPASRSRRTAPRIPLTNPGASAPQKRLAVSTASSIAPSGGIGASPGTSWG